MPADQRFFFGDSGTYWQLGERIARGEDYIYQPDGARVLRTPGYPLLLAGMFRLLGGEPSVMAGRALSALLGAAAVAGTIGWASWLFDPRAGLLAGLIAAIYPGAIAMGVFVLSGSGILSVDDLAAVAVGRRRAGRYAPQSYLAFGRVPASPPDWRRWCARVGCCSRRLPGSWA